MQAGGGDFEDGIEEEDDGHLNNQNNDVNGVDSPSQVLADELDDEEEFRPRWSDADNPAQPLRPPVQPQVSAACVSITYPLLPNCLALVFKTTCAVHSICPNCPTMASSGTNKYGFAHAAVESDLGYRIFKAFRDTNRKYLFWHRDLSRCLRRLEYVGFIQPCTVLVSTAGGDEWLDVLKRCWSQQLLVSPPSYALEVLAEVQSYSMQSVCQSSAVNLIDAICGVICDLAFTSLPSTLDVIFGAVSNKYSACGADIPPIGVFGDMLNFLVAKRRVLLTPNGCYRMASKESFAHHNHHAHHHQHRSRQRPNLFIDPNNSNQAATIGQFSKQAPGRLESPVKTNQPPDQQHVSIFRRLFKRRFFGRAKSRDSTPPPQGFVVIGGPDQPSSSSPPPVCSRATQVIIGPTSATSPPLHSNLLPYRGAGPHLMIPARPPGLFDCYATGAVPSVSCSTNTMSANNNENNLGSITRSRNGHQYRSHPLRRWPQKTTTSKFASSTMSNQPEESLAGVSAPFSTPTSAYLSSSANNVVVPDRVQAGSAMCDEGYEGGLASGCADIQAGEDEVEVEQDTTELERTELQSITSSASSSSWSSSVGNNNNSSSNAKNEANSVSKNEDQTDDKKTNSNETSDQANIDATCAKIVSAELDSLIERYRQIGPSTAQPTSNNNANNSLADCASRASTGTLFSIGDYMVYSAGLMVDPDDQVSAAAPKLVEQFAADSVVTGTTTIITIEDADESAKAVNGEAMLKVDAGQAIFGA